MSADLNDWRGGAVAVYKPYGITSHDVVFKMRKLFGTRKVGHTGTLDPMATGVLVVLVGRAVKASDLVMAGQKSYRATLKLGVRSDTEDITGNLEYSNAEIPQRDEVLSVISSFVGESMQIPPMYSALKVNGQKLVDLARQGITVEREARPINVYSIEASGSGDTYVIDVECSKGTYIRTLCADIGEKLGCGAVMSALERRSSGGFSISDTVKLEELEAMSIDERLSAVSPCEKLFSEYPAVVLPDFYAGLYKNGCEIYQKKIKTRFDAGVLVRVYDGSGFLGIGAVGEYDEGTAIKVKAFL